ncbi:MAG: putative lipid II flippase FtsW [Chromatiales bacterium]|jgi:cell division protein FtsW|nr:putative lipid II flippase FtsW [Chromatiales bacterium]
MSRAYSASSDTRMPDGTLLFVCIVLLCGGLVMLTSASISLAESSTGQPFYYLQRQMLAVLVGLMGGAVMLRIPSEFWESAGLSLVFIAALLLIIVLLPGLGRTVNGATRWLSIAGINMQVSEPARLLILMWLAGYAVRQQAELLATWQGFFKPMLVMAIIGLLLLQQPDFGATTVLLAVTLGVLFVAGGRLKYFIVCCVAVVAALAALAAYSPYRLKRVTGFLDPWADPFDSGFQLTQSLIAIGSGDVFGLGLGNSVQKLFYLPEAHTDFIFAVIAEEFGLVGSLLVILLFATLVWRIVVIARQSAVLNRMYQAYLAFGIAIWLGVQSLINIGVNMGVFPTKGLTLPLVSYGRSSLIITMIALGLLMRIDLENQRAINGGSKRKTRRSAR